MKKLCAKEEAKKQVAWCCQWAWLGGYVFAGPEVADRPLLQSPHNFSISLRFCGVLAEISKQNHGLSSNTIDSTLEQFCNPFGPLDH